MHICIGGGRMIDIPEFVDREKGKKSLRQCLVGGRMKKINTAIELPGKVIMRL